MGSYLIYAAYEKMQKLYRDREGKAELERLKRNSFSATKCEAAPCYICGYNGENYRSTDRATTDPRPTHTEGHMMEWTTEYIKRLQEERDAYRKGGVTEEILRRNDGFIKLGNGCTVVREEERAKWTTTKPTIPGWYWWRSGKYRAAIYRVDWIGKNKKRLYVSECGELSDFKGGEWQGPLEPKEKS